jgi:hypothetical protein
MIRRYVKCRITIHLLEDCIIPELTLLKVKLSLLVDPVLKFHLSHPGYKQITRYLLMNRYRERPR